MQLSSQASIQEHLSSLYQNRDPSFNLPPLDFNLPSKDYWKLLSTSIITPFAPKFKIFEYKKYLRDIKSPPVSMKYQNRLSLSPSNSDENLTSKNFTEQTPHHSFTEIRETSRAMTFVVSPPKTKNQTEKLIKKSHSFIENHQDLITTLNAECQKMQEDGSLRSFSNIAALDKIKPRLRSFLYLSHAIPTHHSILPTSTLISQLQSHAPKKPQTLKINRLILQVRRKSCGCKLCGGFCHKVLKETNHLTQKEIKTVIENQQKFLEKPKEKKKEPFSSTLKSKRTFISHTEDKRHSMEENMKSSATLRTKRNAGVPSEKRRDSEENASKEMMIKDKYTPVRTKLNKILNFNQLSTTQCKSTNSALRSEGVLSSASFNRIKLKERSQINEKYPSLIIKPSEKLSCLIEHKISPKKASNNDIPSNYTSKNVVLKQFEDRKSKLRKKISIGGTNLRPYIESNRDLIGLAKKLNKERSLNSSNSFLIKHRKKTKKSEKLTVK